MNMHSIILLGDFNMHFRYPGGLPIVTIAKFGINWLFKQLYTVVRLMWFLSVVVVALAWFP